MREDAFLKDLYLFMRKRDTPIERIPHLGFKQIDLFMMYTTVRDLGGYHQVTTHQLWKQVYNTLGGNPRSTSAATCTRRHYERLLLPYECHVKGGKYLEALPRQNRRVHNSSLSEEDSPQPAKRSLQERALQNPLHQSPHSLLANSRVRMGPMPVHYRPYYHPRPPPLAYISESRPVIPKRRSSAPQQHVLSPSSPASPVDSSKQPLEHLRYLAERYKSSSGCSEPLNLSCKGSDMELSIHAASSFTPTISNKTPKFLNQVSSLYQSKGPANEEQLEENVEGDMEPANPLVREVIDLTSTSRKSSYNPSLYLGQTLNTESVTSAPLSCHRERAADTPSPSTRTFQQRPEKEREGILTPTMGPLNLSCSLPNTPMETGGRMEIQIPLAVFQDWVKGGYVTASSVSTKLSAAPSSELGNSERLRSSPPFSSMIANLSNLIFNKHHRDQDKGQYSTDTNCHTRASCDFLNYMQLPESHHLRDASLWNQWHEKETLHGLRNPQNSVKQSGMGPPAVLMVNPSSPSLVPLTTEEFFKLKRLISNSY